jgi:two-component system chemotaxis response regulator CheB
MPEYYPGRVVSLLPDVVPADGGARFTGIACPDYSGVLTLKAHGSLVTFACRVGHMYSCAELLAAKEELLERRLWIAFSSLDELAMLLEDFHREGLEPTQSEAHRRRGAIAREQAARVRDIIEADRPLLPQATEATGDAP